MTDFKPTNRIVVDAGSCTCTWEDGPGDIIDGPEMIRQDPDCPIHGRDAMPGAWNVGRARTFGSTRGPVDVGTLPRPAGVGRPYLGNAGWGCQHTESGAWLSDAEPSAEAAIAAAADALATDIPAGWTPPTDRERGDA